MLSKIASRIQTTLWNIELRAHNFRRGAGFLEYALLALIGLGVFLALNVFFPDVLKGFWNSIKTAVTGNSKTTGGGW